MPSDQPGFEPAGPERGRDRRGCNGARAGPNPYAANRDLRPRARGERAGPSQPIPATRGRAARADHGPAKRNPRAAFDPDAAQPDDAARATDRNPARPPHL